MDRVHVGGALLFFGKDIFHDDHGRIDKNTDREREPRKRHDVDTNPGRRHADKGRHEGAWNDREDDGRKAPFTEKKVNDGHGQDQPDQQSPFDIVNGALDRVRAVVDNYDLDRIFLFYFKSVEYPGEIIGDIQRIRETRLFHINRHVLLEIQTRLVGGFEVGIFDRREFLQRDDRALAGSLYAQIPDLVHRQERSHAADREFIFSGFHVPGEQVDVALPKHVHNPLNRDVISHHLVPVELHQDLAFAAAIDLDARDPVHAAQNRLQLDINQFADLFGRERFGCHRENKDGRLGVIIVRDNRLFDLLGKKGPHAGKFFPDLQSRKVHVRAGFKFHCHAGLGFAGARIEVLHLAHGPDGFLDRLRDHLFNVLGRKAATGADHDTHDPLALSLVKLDLETHKRD
ncbi:MAG: hypothetical protein BWY49_00484 [Candidatus Omnitrophica bacterium ADurb.Bin314]|nr:MAG: hypothetical protein BWY49_00484 [Candidatus Omnitrophica bacterium ADurb.Bin314]